MAFTQLVCWPGTLSGKPADRLSLIQLGPVLGIDRNYHRKIESITYRERGVFEVPLYEYQCKNCHSLTERIQKFSDPPLTICPHCGGELEQLISAPAVQFKGAGWYVTDYAKKSGTTAASGNVSTESSASASETKSSTESKPDAPKSGASNGKDAK